ncbi:MAG: DNA translocase FtsK, partial [Leadbetterella sp.]|nr:DNA translocase FtsK [Leadbetterella sp.]
MEFNAAAIKKTLQNFGLEVEMSEINVGPTVTQYTLKPADGVKLSKITGLNNDLALALAAHPIRIEAPIPGKSFVGIEVPNSIRAKVKLGSVIVTPEFQKPTAILNLALGKDVMGNPICVDLAGMPHMLVAGATGSGKSICLNAIINSLIFRNSPRNLRLILIDPKRVEFPVYGALPHLLTPVILNSRKAVNVLNWLVGEMERRFEVLQEANVRDIISYNKNQQQKAFKIAKKVNVADPGDDTEPMPYIILIIDELADLMMTKGREVEAAIVRLSQLARAVGIHLVVATQRPSVEVI